MNRFSNTVGLVVGCLLVSGTMALASPVNGTGNVTPDVIYGSGNANGSFTGETRNNIEVGLRAKVRYPVPLDVFNYDGIDSYTFNPTGVAVPTNRSIFNFDWSVNVDQDGTSGAALDDFSYRLSYDTDSSSGISYVSLDPFNTFGYYDHALGDNGTPNGGGVESSDNSVLLLNILAYSVAQQSSNLGFGFLTDPDLPGIYNFRFEVFQKGTLDLLASSEIRVNVIPLPAALPLLAAGLGIFGFTFRRRRTPVAA